MVDLTPRDRLLIELRHSAREWFWTYYDRDGFECESCGETSERIDVHHKDGDAFNNHPTNLVGVCHLCHRRIHSSTRAVEKIDEWKADAPIGRN